MTIKLMIVNPIDPLGPKVGGIETFLKGFIEYAPEDTVISFVGITSDKNSRPPRQWQRLRIGNKEFNFYPLFYEKDENKKKSIPLTLRFAIALKLSSVKTEGSVILCNRIESVAALSSNSYPRVAVIHHDVQKQIIDKKGEFFWANFPFLYHLFEEHVFNSLNCIYTIGINSLNYYRSCYPELTNKFLRLSLWVDSAIFQPSDESKCLLRQKVTSLGYSLPAMDKWILFAGRLQKVKAPLRLLGTFDEYNKINKNACLLIVGDGNMRVDIERQIKKSGMQNKIFLIGAVNAQALAFFYKASDALLLASDSETGSSCCVLEALGCGLPVISTDVGDVRNFIKNGFSGEVVNTFVPSDLAGAIEKVLNNPHTYTKENCADSIAEYTPKKVLDPVYEMLRELYKQNFKK